MAQNIYDNPDFFAGYSQLPRQVQGLDGAPEWPAIRALLPEVAGKRVADLGCGFGWASRWFREQGAETVLGIDLSRKMIDRALADTDDPAINYRIADLDTLELSDAAFDLIYSALTFHYVRDFGLLMRTLHRALTRGGDLVFTIEHPIFMAAIHPDWIEDENGRKTWPVNGYSTEGERSTNWFRRGGAEAASDTGDYDKHLDRRGLRSATDRGICTDIGPDRGDAKAGRRDGAANDVDGFGIQELISFPPGPTGRAACYRMP
ncbi:bifunctional 2-polyprenyl-6-hydroxyphenol methylase/3-demethylubiquinol 3-O-methyltransferase UbiG [Roseovarius sp. THAF9]|uniref:class I SAM-dependent methyltransferase n=1 Tax=Roseovarius sp. THAF9 TaxID=2587847 RepID=UPI0020C7C90A|nr:class I SAM-dependent methyltransferase [Roseovarius sp. THAF9]